MYINIEDNVDGNIVDHGQGTTDDSAHDALEDVPLESIEESIWQKIEKSLHIKMPPYLKELLIINGYDNAITLSKLDNNLILEIESFAKNILPSLISDDDSIKYYGIFSKDISKFTIVGGHRILLKKIAEYLNEDLKKNESSDEHVQQARQQGSLRVLGKSKNVLQRECSNTKRSIKRTTEITEQVTKNKAEYSMDINLEKNKINKNCIRFIEENYNTFLEKVPEMNNPSNSALTKSLANTLEKLDMHNLDFNVRIYKNQDLDESFDSALVRCCFCNGDIKIPKTTVINASSKEILYWVYSNFYKHVKIHFETSKNKKIIKNKTGENTRNKTIDKYFSSQGYSNYTSASTSANTSINNGKLDNNQPSNQPIIIDEDENLSQGSQTSSQAIMSDSVEDSLKDF